MVWAAVVQHYIYQASHQVLVIRASLRCDPDEPVWLLRGHVRRRARQSARLALERVDPDRVVSCGPGVSPSTGGLTHRTMQIRSHRVQRDFCLDYGA